MGKRVLVRHHLNYLKDDHPLDFEDIDTNFIELYLDLENAENIKKIVGTNKPKFRQILYHILHNINNDSLYRKEGEDVYSMRFMGYLNSRVYCKEINDSPKRIIMCIGYENKTSVKNDKRLKSLISAIEKYKEFIYFQTYQEYENWKRK
jgi:hypothetical protein